MVWLSPKNPYNGSKPPKWHYEEINSLGESWDIIKDLHLPFIGVQKYAKEDEAQSIVRWVSVIFFPNW